METRVTAREGMGPYLSVRERWPGSLNSFADSIRTV